MQSLTQLLLDFRDERDWAQFHDSRNLSLALSIEAAELNELFLWSPNGQLPEGREERLAEELADVLAYALLLAHNHGLNVDDIVRQKVAKNALKYPAEKARGTSAKYNELGQ